MIADPDDHVRANESEWALHEWGSHLVALMTAVLIVAGGFFVLNFASREYRIVNVSAPPALDGVLLAVPPTDARKTE
jgi:hypothetical protein